MMKIITVVLLIAVAMVAAAPSVMNDHEDHSAEEHHDQPAHRREQYVAGQSADEGEDLSAENHSAPNDEEVHYPIERSTEEHDEHLSEKPDVHSVVKDGDSAETMSASHHEEFDAEAEGAAEPEPTHHTDHVFEPVPEPSSVEH